MDQTQIFKHIDSVLKDIVNEKLSVKLDKLGDILKNKYKDTPYYDQIMGLLDEQRYPVRTVIRLNHVRKTRTKKEIDPELRCVAKIGLGTQCSRSRSAGLEYCKSHQLSLPYGRIDDVDSGTKSIKRRGRKSKQEKQYTVNDLDLDKYVQAIQIKIGDDTYLLDQNNIIYLFNDYNEIVGKLVEHEQENKVEWLV